MENSIPDPTAKAEFQYQLTQAFSRLREALKLAPHCTDQIGVERLINVLYEVGDLLEPDLPPVAESDPL
jgi:hypothetical protein